MDGDDAERDGRTGNPLRAAFEEFIERTRSAAEEVISAGGSTFGAVAPAVPGLVTDLLGSLQGLVDEAPAPLAAVELFVEEVKAKRALVQALATQLMSFDRQLEVMERSLAPLQVWAEQWESMRGSVSDRLRYPRPTGVATEAGRSPS